MLSFDTLTGARDAIRNRDISATELTRQAHETRVNFYGRAMARALEGR